MAIRCEFEGPVKIEGKEDGKTAFSVGGFGGSISISGALLNGEIRVAAENGISVRMASNRILSCGYKGAVAGRKECAVVVSGTFVLRGDPGDGARCRVRTHSTATLDARTAQSGADAEDGTATLQAESRADVSWGPISDRKRRREDRTLDGSDPRRYPVEFKNPSEVLNVGEAYAFAVSLVLEAAKWGAGGSGSAEAVLGSSPGEFISTLAVVEGEDEKRGSTEPR